MRSVRPLFVVVSVLFMTACAVALGGPSPEEYDALALFEPRDADADAVAARIRETGAELVLLSSERQDSAWFAYVAYQAGLGLTNPGAIGSRGYAFLTTRSLELLGDTTLALDVAGGGQVQMHDALYRIDDSRYLDLMMVRLESADVREAVRTLLGYIATDVMGTASVLLAIDGATQTAADSAAILMRATFGNAGECAAAPRGERSVRLLYGPSARVRCLGARALPDGSGITGRFEVGR